MNAKHSVPLTEMTSKLLSSIVLVSALGQTLNGQIIPPSRRVDWVLGETVGVPGGIPKRTTIFTNFTASATAAQINNALAICPSNQVVKLAAGRFTIDSTLNFGQKRGVTLRGAGLSTILALAHDNTGVTIGGGSETASAGTAVTAGYAKGSSNLTVASTSGLAVGDLVRVDQILDISIMWSTAGDNDRAVNQRAQIKNISGNVVTIWPPLHYGLTPANSPLLKHYSGARAEMCGIEDLTIDGTGRGTSWGLLFLNTIGCWMKNVRTIKIHNYHVYTLNTLFNEYAKVFIDDSPDYEPNHGGIVLGNVGTYAATATAVYDCILNKILPGIEVNGGTSGCIIAYNYFRDSRYANVAQAVGLNMNHGPQCMMNLYEGNIANMIMSDGYFGGSSHDTLFRNWATGWTETFTNYNSKCIDLNKWTLYYNLIGNVLGINKFVPDYQKIDLPNYGYDISTCFRFGYPNGGNGDYTGTRPPSTDRLNARDLNVESTAIVHGNWDSKTKAVAWSAAIADHNLPDSLYLSSKPAWFGNLTWPPVDPATGYTNLTFSSIPAGYRYINGIDPPGAGEQKPSAPTNLRVVNP